MELHEALEQYKDIPFKYGVHDCCIFVSNIIKDTTGVDHGSQHRGTYSTELGAARIILSYGGLRGMWSKLLGVYRPIWSVRAGDVVYIKPDAIESDSISEMVGVWDGNKVWFVSETGLISADLSIAQGCWNV